METILGLLQGRKTSQFKSYYVVWKLFRYHFFDFWFISLNRTMQYGNGNGRRAVANDTLSLNRTMQYGNRKIVGRLFPQFCGLNRTMQYGNFGIVDPPDAEKKGLNRTMQYGNSNIASKNIRK